MNTLNDKSANKALLLMDFAAHVRSVLGVNINECSNDLFDALEELEREGLVRCNDIRGDVGIVRGLNFDDYFIGSFDRSIYNYSFGSVSAKNVQIGNNNTISIEQGFQELINKINELDVSEKDKDSAKQALRSALSNASIASILGGAVSGLLSLL